MTTGPLSGQPPAYPELASPMRIAQVSIPNRFGMAPMTTNYAGIDGSVTPSLTDYLGARAEGGFGLIVTENFGVHASGRVMPRMAMADSDERIDGMASLVQAVQSHGARIFGQLSHCGRQSRSAFTGGPLVAASAIACPLNREVPRELSLEEVSQAQDWFVAAALRMERAGFDGIELHAAHGYLLGGFLSGYSNRREDRYGGELRARARMLLELVEKIRSKTSLALSVRISTEEFVSGGNGIDDAVAIAGWLRDAGVDAISASVAVYESFNYMSMVGGEPEARWLHLSRAVRQATGLPVMVAGRIHDAARASEAVLTGACDLALFGRSAIADAALPRKSQAGANQEVMPCIACNVCLGRSHRPETICPSDPSVGREARFAGELSRARNTSLAGKRLLIQGSSLASLTAAWLAASGGLAVTVQVTGTFGGLQAARALIPSQAKEYSQLLSAARLRASQAGAQFSEETQDRAAFDWAFEEITEQQQSDPTTLWGAEALYARSAELGGPRQLEIAAKHVAMDAHPGYRASLAARLAGLGFRFAETGPIPRKGESPREAVPPDSNQILDAYEPDRMTMGVYAATELVFDLLREAGAQRAA